MNKHDFLWLALKITGLYLITEGVLQAPVAIVEGELDNVLHTVLPIVVGGIFLGIRASGTTSVESTHAPSSITRSDLLWLICKGVGLWWTIQSLPAVPFAILTFVTGNTPDVWTLVTIGSGLIMGLWLLCSDALPRFVSRLDKPANR